MSLIQNFQSEISGMCVEGVFTGEQGQQLNMVICEHLFRQGKLDVGEKVVQVQLFIMRTTSLRFKLGCTCKSGDNSGVGSLMTRPWLAPLPSGLMQTFDSAACLHSWQKSANAG